MSSLRSYLSLDIQNQPEHKRHALSTHLWNGTELNELELWNVHTLESGGPSEMSFLGHFRTLSLEMRGFAQFSMGTWNLNLNHYSTDDSIFIKNIYILFNFSKKCNFTILIIFIFTSYPSVSCVKHLWYCYLINNVKMKINRIFSKGYELNIQSWYYTI